MKRSLAIAIAVLASLSTSAFGLTTVVGGNHSSPATGLFKFPIIVTSDSNEQIAGLDLLLTITDPNGPVITDVTLIEGTVFESNNTGMTNFGPGYVTPGRNVAYFTTTNAGTVPVGIVAWVTVDMTGVAPGIYNLSLTQDDGDSAALLIGGIPGTFTNGTIGPLCPEPGSVVMATLGAIGLGAAAIRRRRTRSV